MVRTFWKLRLAPVALLCLLLAGNAWGQTTQVSMELGTTSFTANTTGAVTSSNFSFASNVATTTALSLTSGQQGQAGGTGYVSSKGWTTAASISTTQYWEFTVAAASGYQFTSISSIAFRNQRNANGPATCALRSSVDSYAANIGGTQSPTNGSYGTMTFSSLGITNQTSVTFRLYGYSAAAATGTFRIGDGAASSIDIDVKGTVASTGTAPTVSTDAIGTVTFNSAVLNGSVSAAGTPTSATNKKGFVYSLTSTNATPTIGGTGVVEVINTTGTLATGSFTNTPNTLASSSGYSWRAYAINDAGTTYGSVSTFTTSASPTASLSISGTAAHGSSCVGVAASPITYTITNTGGADATGISVASDNAEFAITTALSSTTVTQSGGTVTFGVTFTPSASGSRTANLTVTGGGGATYAISGTGTALVAPPAPTANTATGGGTGGATLGGTTTAATCPTTLTEQGVVLSSTVTTPTLADTKFTFSNNTPGVKTTTASGLNPGTRYYYRAYASNSQGTTYNATVNSFNTRKLEPSNHVTSFTKSAQTGTSMTFTWTDNAGAAAADSFLVRLSTGTPTDPTDGTAVTANASSDVYVAAGVQTVTFTGLTTSTTYTAKIYPLVNTGLGGIDYKTSATVPSASGTTNAGPLAAWNLTSTTTSATTTGGGITSASAITVSPSSTISYSSPFIFAASWSTSATFSTSGKYWQFSVTPNGAMTISGVSFDAGRTAAGPASMQVQYSLDGFATAGVDALVGANNANTSSLTTFNLTSLPPTTAGTVTFRIWGYNASSTGNFRLNNVVINGTVANAPSLSVSQTVTQASGSAFAYGSVEAGSFSDKVFTLTNNGSATLNISSISTSGTGYSIQAGGSTTTIPASGTANVTVRYTPSSFSLQAGTFDIQSNDITNPTYTVNLTGVATPSVQSDIANLTTSNATVDYTLYQSSTISNVTSGANGSYGLLRFDIRDGGGAADNDALPTILQDITFTVNNGAAIRQAALFSTSNAKLNTADPVINAGTGTIAFSGLPAGSFTVSDGGTLSIWLRVSFTTTVTDNQAITVSVSNTNTVAAGSNTSSGFKTFSLTSSGTANKTLVTGNSIGFAAQPPSSVGISSNFGLSVQVQDANGNRDLDVNTGTISIIKLTGGGTLSGGTSGSIASGVFTTSTLQLDQITTGVTLQASITPTLGGTSVIVTNSFVVSGVGYTVGCYRTKASGTTNWATASNWEYLDTDGVTWLAASAAPDDPALIAHVERSMTMGNYGGSYSRWTLNTLYVKNSGTVLTTNSGTSPGLDIVGTNGELRILNGAKVAATAGINFRDVVFSISASTAKLTVDSLSTLSINYTCNNQSLIWNGVENFKNGSILEILFWDVSTSALVDPTASRTVTPNAAGYCFGKININSTNGNTMKLVSSTTPVKLCQNDLTIISNNSFNVIGSTDAATVTYGGINVQADQLSFYGVTSASTLTSTVEGNLSVSGNATIDLNQNNAAGGSNTIILKGNYSNTGTADIKCTDAAGTGIIQFDGGKSHTVTQSTTWTDPCVNIAWQITSADTVAAASNWGLSNNASVTVQTGGMLQFGNNGSAPYRVLEVASAAATTAFTLQTGATLVINDQNGITSSGATGNVQTDTRSFSNGSNYYYKTYAGFTQATGSAFDALAASPFTGVITWEGFSNAQSLTFTSSFTINTPGKLVVKKGFIAESATVGQPTIDGTGGLDMSGGQLVYNRVGSSLTFPRLTGTYAITGGTISLNGTANSASNLQQLRGGRTYFDVSLGGSSSSGGYKTVTSAVVINGTLTIPTGEIFDPASSGVTGPGNLTMTGGVYRTSKLTNNQPELGGTYTLSAGTVELYGTSASQQQNLRSKDDANNTITYATILVNAAAANRSGNVDLTGLTAVSTELRVNSPAYLNMDAAEGVTGNGNFVLTSGTGLRFANAYGIRTSGTGSTDGNIRVSGTRSLSTQATYIAAGSAASASLGNAIPDGADSVIIARTSGDISTAGALKVGQKLRFASASKILTGTDTVTIGSNGFVVGEAEDRYVYGLLKVYRASIAQNVLTDIGGMGLTVEALGGAPGYFTATRRTGAGSVQTGYQNNVSTARYYSLHAANNSGLNAKVTFSYFDSELGAVPENLLTAYRSQDNGATWNMYPALARNPVQNFVRVQNVPGFSQWVLGSYDSPLPVELSSFTGHLQGRVAVLDWATASERNNAGFELLRSADGRNFVKIGWVAAKPEARGGSYSFTDAGFTGKAYYRLRQVDRDGAAKESQTVFLSRDNAELTTAQLFPMPAQGKLTLTWPGQEEQIVTARLLSVDGKLIQTGTGSLAEISALLSAQVSALPSGVYQLHLVGAEQAQTILRVVK